MYITLLSNKLFPDKGGQDSSSLYADGLDGFDLGPLREGDERA